MHLAGFDANGNYHLYPNAEQAAAIQRHKDAEIIKQLKLREAEFLQRIKNLEETLDQALILIPK